MSFPHILFFLKPPKPPAPESTSGQWISQPGSVAQAPSKTQFVPGVVGFRAGLAPPNSPTLSHKP